MPRIARVEPLTTTRRVAGPFDYALPEAPVDVGSVVRIPFGHQRLTGVVTGLAEESEIAPERLVAPTEVLPEAVPADLVELALWMAEEYCSTPARALSLVLPPPGRPRTALWAQRTEVADADGARLTDRQRAVLARLPGPAGADLPILRRLEGRGLVTLAPRIQRRAPHTATHADRPVELNAEQAAALEDLEARAGEAVLLHGVTGSGKTEVYLRAAAAALGRGRGVIVLVPEIALTPQTVGRFAARFGDTVALLHSALSEGERHDEWRRLRAGEARIAVGPRSAVFAPVADLGLIVVDEEHDASYKHEGDPRYDARRVAAWRARYFEATLLAGTATPRPESWRALPRVTLPHRVDGARLPAVDVLDMREARHPLHPETHRALHAARKSIVLLNRRGWSNFLTCRTCGKVWECPNCDVALVLHRAKGEVACHHCGHRERVPDRCDHCGSLAVARYGAGTERIEHELTEQLDVPVFRLDADTTGTKDSLGALLEAFRAAPAGLLLGTQMVAKGHDFPDVTLGVVLDADSTLRFPDFRAEERTFALIAQLAGRAGRGHQGGRVLVQTLDPEAPAIAAAARHDAPAFLAGELERREALNYPPFSTLVRITTTAERDADASAAANDVADAVSLAPASVLGPAPLFRLRGRERRQIVVKTQERQATIGAIRAAVDAAANDRAHRAVAFSVDVDPQ
ncbi:MAG: Helicase PriA essential for oriC/DnaA-independent DNA replication [uncultured Solirubrobacteraceae bacterium]|uniref:Replication restart protein PriA n=1 Tax=uncultured Solirubrobacteraceae bacterium TaxID=1162706 RepID=A0A6J4SJ42_9ACTN|nr:MAG: Helicase PriA essential for oriC/DnaA-independent DNA replication [uncultured Solirubrobacteraceae bacterium]